MVLFLCAYIRPYLVEFIISTEFGRIGNLYFRPTSVKLIVSTRYGCIYSFDQIQSHLYFRPNLVENIISIETGDTYKTISKFKSAAIFPPTKYFRPEVIFDQNHGGNKMEGPVERMLSKIAFFSIGYF